MGVIRKRSRKKSPSVGISNWRGRKSPWKKREGNVDLAGANEEGEGGGK